MTVISPSLALALVVLYVLTRVNQKNFTFERLLYVVFELLAQV
jgi:hypothetical protein